MAITNQQKELDVATGYLNLPSTSGISPQGYWYKYIPVDAGNTQYGAAFKPYRWNTPLNLFEGAETLTMDGTIALIQETWQGSSLQYHGSSIVWIGAGVNDITATQEADAFFFAHLGSLSPATDDDAFYWDRAYTDINGIEWQYYQYHKHLPSFYPQFENGRMTHSARHYINPADKAYGYMINTRITVMGVDYQSVLARVHTPSIGGAHNSHNDVTLPSVSTKNYMPGGILAGNSDRFHAFYITANGNQWDVFTRTYSQNSLSFSAEVNLGTYDLADPTFNPVSGTGTQSQYPVRASAGSVYGPRIYFPVIFNNPTSGFDLRIWSLSSLDTIAGGSLIEYTIATGLTSRPDCHAIVFNDQLFVVYTDTTNNGVSVQSYDDTTDAWTNQGVLVTNGSNHLRVHGFDYNPADTKFYVLLSGTSTGTGTYSGSGMYTFQLTGSFLGYRHYDYDATTNSFVDRDPLQTGYLEYNQIDATLTRYNATEPAGIALGTNILNYALPEPTFLNRTEVALGGDEYYYHGITLRDGRKLLAGRIEDNKGNKGAGDFLLTLINNGEQRHFAWGGDGDDYLTSLHQSKSNPNRVWMTGYTKSKLVDIKDIKIHGFCRNIADATNLIEFVDLVVQADGSMIVVGNHNAGYIMIFKYNSNYEIEWQNTYDGDVNVDTASALAVTEDGTIYISGTSSALGEGGTEAILLRVSGVDGRLQSVTSYGTSSEEVGTSLAIVKNGGIEYVLLAATSGTSTTLLSLALDGSIVLQNKIDNLSVSRLRADKFNTNTGNFLFVGTDGASTAKFGAGTLSGSPMLLWVDTYGSSSAATDIKQFDASTFAVCGYVGNSSLILKFQVSGTSATKTWARSLNDSSFASCTIINDEVYAVGYTTSSGDPMMGLDDGLIVKLNVDGTIAWQNVYGHFADERFLAIEADVSQENIIMVGWSESHSYGRDGILLRTWTGGFGLGLHHIEGNPGVHYAYARSSLSDSVETSTLTDLSPDPNQTGLLVRNGGLFIPFTGIDFTVSNSGTNNYLITGGDFVDEPDPTITLARGGTYTFTMTYSGSHPFYIKELDVPGLIGIYSDGVTGNGATAAGQVITFTVPANAPDTLYYRCATHSGMGGTLNIVDNPSLLSGFTSVDYQYETNRYDGSFGKDGVFMLWMGYVDLIALQQRLNSPERRSLADQTTLDYTDSIFTFYQVATIGDGTADDGNIFGYEIMEASNGMVWVIGQTSGDISKVNSGDSGVYDYLLVEFDPTTEEFEYYQNGTELDEETYALTELADGKIAYVGRTTGSLGGTPQGGYDIFLGIFDPVTETSSYYSTGTGLDDKAVDVHDLGNNTLAIVFSTYGVLGPTNSGTEDIGVILFNYDTDIWGDAYQAGSLTSEIFEQNGKPSVLLDDGRIAITCSSAGIFADNEVTYGFLDMCVGVINLTTGKWSKYQIGSGASDFATSIDANGDRLMISGYTRATFADQRSNAVFIELDVQYGVGAKSAS